ncbi:hypothetical protein CESP606_20070 [Cereibacter sphaeroides]|nr:hypothetical protein RSP03_37000 [Cereibacter sphaeroides]
MCVGVDPHDERQPGCGGGSGEHGLKGEGYQEQAKQACPPEMLDDVRDQGLHHMYPALRKRPVGVERVLACGGAVEPDLEFPDF